MKLPARKLLERLEEDRYKRMNIFSRVFSGLNGLAVVGIREANTDSVRLYDERSGFSTRKLTAGRGRKHWLLQSKSTDSMSCR